MLRKEDPSEYEFLPQEMLGNLLLEKYILPAGDIDAQIILSEVQRMDCCVRNLFESFLCGNDEGYYATVGEIIGLGEIDGNYPLSAERSIQDLLYLSGPFEVPPVYRDEKVVDVSVRMLVEEGASAVHPVDAFISIDRKVKLVMGVLEKLEKGIIPDDMFWSA